MGLDEKLRQAVEGDVFFDRFERGRYATDASIYQVLPKGVVVPKNMADVEATIALCREAGAAIVPRGGGTSQCGQTVNDAVVLDLSKHLHRCLEIDPEAMRAKVQPGLVLDELNRELKPLGLTYPVDVSTASRATIGGMTANNSCGSRSLRYGTSRDNVHAIDAILADGTKRWFGPNDAHVNPSSGDHPNRGDPLSRDLFALGAREARKIAARFPRVSRRVGGYNIDALVPGASGNLAELLVGSEGTLAFFEQIELKLSPLPTEKVLGVCHFPTFHSAMDAAQHIVALGPTSVELFDETLLSLARDIALFQPIIDSFVRGSPAALLIVEFAESDPVENKRRLQGLHDVMAELGFAFGDPGKREGGVVDAIDPAFQSRIVGVRSQGLNIMMSMRSAGKPVSFIEDCCVELKDLAAYTDQLTEIFARHGSQGTFYAHAAVGTLHVRPVLNLKLDADVKTMRAIAEETFALVRHYQGSHSGEHGDGIVRSEFHAAMFGERMVAAFGEVKNRFDPDGLFNPHRIVDPPKMDDRNLFRYQPNYRVPEMDTVFDWVPHVGAGRGLQGAVEMCNNNGACRKLTGDVMCPSFRVTGDERHLVRGRANTLRLALSGQLGPQALQSDAMAETMSLCVSCKACRRECPTGVDMAKMKIEVQAARRSAKGLSWRDRATAYLPRYAPLAARVPGLTNWASRLAAPWLGFAKNRPLPVWHKKAFESSASDNDADILLFADCFNRYFEPDNLHAAKAVLAATGQRVGHACGKSSDRPLCCGRTYLSAGMADEAKAEMRRTIRAIKPALERGTAVVGLEPSCLLTFRDEAPALLGEEWDAGWGGKLMLFEEFLNGFEGELTLDPGVEQVLVHGHCHQKSFNLMGSITTTLKRLPGAKVETIASSCCGMAGAFGYQAETAEISNEMAELSLLPKVRAAAADTVLVAPGTSCRHQIALGSGRHAVHPAVLLARQLPKAV